jgi:SAM-dependent methyltransferase
MSRCGRVSPHRRGARLPAASAVPPGDGTELRSLEPFRCPELQAIEGAPGWSMTHVGSGEGPWMVAWMGDEPDVRAWVNADQAAGKCRVRYAELFDAEARLHAQQLHAAANVGAAEHVLDIGCGTGRSTRAAGRAAAAGTVLGVDISALVLKLARRLTDREGLRNVSYRLADAQVDGLGPARFDV